MYNKKFYNIYKIYFIVYAKKIYLVYIQEILHLSKDGCIVEILTQ